MSSRAIAAVSGIVTAAARGDRYEDAVELINELCLGLEVDELVPILRILYSYLAELFAAVAIGRQNRDVRILAEFLDEFDTIAEAFTVLGEDGPPEVAGPQ